MTKATTTGLQCDEVVLEDTVEPPRSALLQVQSRQKLLADAQANCGMNLSLEFG